MTAEASSAINEPTMPSSMLLTIAARDCASSINGVKLSKLNTLKSTSGVQYGCNATISNATIGNTEMRTI